MCSSAVRQSNPPSLSAWWGEWKESLLSVGRRWLGVGGVWALLWLAGCSSTPVAPPPSVPVPPPVAVPQPDDNTLPPPLPPHQAQSVVLQAMGLVGTPYRYGGNTPEAGFDCSGLIAYVYREAAGLSTPRTVAELSRWGHPVPAHQARTGDLAVFTVKGRTNHAGIYVGEGRFVHAPSTGGTVKLDRLDRGYWARQGLSFRRHP